MSVLAAISIPVLITGSGLAFAGLAGGIRTPVGSPKAGAWGAAMTGGLLIVIIGCVIGAWNS